MATQEKRMGDRFDATLVRDIDPLHWFMPYLYPNRADNEAFIREEFDLTNLEAFLEKKNKSLDKAHRLPRRVRGDCEDLYAAAPDEPLHQGLPAVPAG